MTERPGDEAAPGAAAEERRSWQRALLDESPLAIAMAAGGLTTYGNAGYLKLFGYQRLEELLGRPLVEQIAPESRVAMLDRIERRRRGEAVPPSIEVIALRKDGGRFVDLITSKTLQPPTGTSVLDEKGVITEWNLAMARVTGVPGEAARGRSGWELMIELAVPGGGPEWLAPIQRATLVEPQGEGLAHALSAELSIRRRHRRPPRRLHLGGVEPRRRLGVPPPLPRVRGPCGLGGAAGESHARRSL